MSNSCYNVGVATNFVNFYIMCKHQALLENVVFKYHPEFGRKAIRDFALRNPKAFNIEHLIEETIALYGGFEHTPSDGYDLTAKNGKQVEVKAISIHQNNSYRKPSFKSALKVGAKTGDIMAVCYNPFSKKKVHFLYVPLNIALDVVSGQNLPAWQKAMTVTWHPCENENGIFSGALSGLEVESFEILCSRV